MIREALLLAPFRLLFGDIVWLNRTGTSIVSSATDNVPVPTQLATVDRQPAVELCRRDSTCGVEHGEESRQ